VIQLLLPKPGVNFTQPQCTGMVAAVSGGMAGDWLAGQYGYVAAFMAAAF